MDLPSPVTLNPMRTFHLLVANTLAASVTNNFLWFALTFWIYLETRSVVATAIIGGGYMLLAALSAMAFGTFVDRHLRADVDDAVEPGLARRLRSRGRPLPGGAGRGAAGHRESRLLGPVVLVLAGAIAGNLRSVALSTTVTLLVPEDRRDKANGLVGTANGMAFAITSVFSGLADRPRWGWAAPRDRRRPDHARDPPPPDDPDPRRTAPTPSGTAALHRRRAARAGGSGRVRSARAVAVLDVQQPPRRRVHGPHRPLRAHADVGRGVGRC